MYIMSNKYVVLLPPKSKTVVTEKPKIKRVVTETEKWTFSKGGFISRRAVFRGGTVIK